MKARMIVAACLMVAWAGAASAAKPPTDQQRMRQEAEHLCYDDVQRLCNAAIPDEERIKACMKVNHDKLSAPCAKIYDQGLGG